MTYWKALPLPVHNGFLPSPVKSPNLFSSYDAIYFYPKTQLSKFAKENTGLYRKIVLNEGVWRNLLQKLKKYKKK